MISGWFGDNGELWFEVELVAATGEHFAVDALLDTGPLMPLTELDFFLRSRRCEKPVFLTADVETDVVDRLSVGEKIWLAADFVADVADGLFMGEINY